jgi:hypothetical protein
MFAPYCPVHGSRVLLSLDDIERLEHTSNGIAVHYRCLCGYRGVWNPQRIKTRRTIDLIRGEGRL